MRIRRARRKKIRAALRAATVVLVVAAALFVIWHTYPHHPATTGMQEFFSDDNGKTWFPDDGTKIAPFDHNGKQAVMVKVYQAKDGTQFVGYMMKFTDQAKKKIQDAQATHQPRIGLSTEKSPTTTGVMLKRPTDKNWIPQTDPKAKEIRKVKSPAGSTDVVPVPP